jgi:hypothetical protein
MIYLSGKEDFKLFFYKLDNLFCLPTTSVINVLEFSLKAHECHKTWFYFIRLIRLAECLFTVQNIVVVQ